MNKLLTLLFSISLIACCNKPKLLNNGLTKKATKITEYIFDVKIKDTLTIIKKKYNNNNQIISKNQWNLFDNGTITTEFIYNKNKKIKREIVKLSNDSSSFIVGYFYKGDLHLKTQSETKNKIFHFKHVKEYEYNADNTLKQSSLLQQYINIESNDTITNTLQISNYNKKEIVTESKLFDFIKPEQNRVNKYDYDCRTLMNIMEFNSKDSLISKMKFKYELDEFENWIKMELFKNDKLNSIRTREIEYK